MSIPQWMKKVYRSVDVINWRQKSRIYISAACYHMLRQYNRLRLKRGYILTPDMTPKKRCHVCRQISVILYSYTYKTPVFWPSTLQRYPLWSILNREKHWRSSIYIGNFQFQTSKCLRVVQHALTACQYVCQLFGATHGVKKQCQTLRRSSINFTSCH